MIGLSSFLLTLAATVCGFLILYNNLYHGIGILGFLILFNVALLTIPSRQFRNPRPLSVCKTTSVCLIAVGVALLFIEALFPIAMPKEYAQVKELSKGFVAPAKEPMAEDCMVYANPDQLLRPVAVQAASTTSKFKAWHVPGKQFAYHGYDPNSGRTYVNRFQWNALGYYDHDHDLQKSKSVRRIVVIGDSFVEAIQVPLEKTFHKLLERLLNQSQPQGPSSGRYEVIALGNSGAGQVENFKILRSIALSYQPDLVIVALCSNDFCDDDPALSTDRLLAQGDVSRSFRGLVVHGYHAMAFAFRRYNDVRRNRISISPELLQWAAGDYPRVEAAWKRTLSLASDSNDLCRKQGIPFALLYLGSDLEVRHILRPDETIDRLRDMGGPHGSIEWDLSKSLRRVRSYCASHKIQFISLLEPLAAAQAGTGTLVFGDHYTAFGHQVAAGVLFCALENGLNNRFAEDSSLQHCLSSLQWGTAVLGLETTR